MEKEKNYNICNKTGECGIAWQQGLFEVKTVRKRQEQIQFQPGINKVLENPDEIAKALNLVIKSRATREKMGLRSLELATQKFSFDKMLSGTIDIYNM